MRISRPRYLRLLLLSLTVAIVVAVPAIAQAPWKTYPTKVFVSEKFPALHGALHSPSRACVARRRLIVYRSLAAGRDQLVGRGFSHRRGAWRVSLGEKLERGHYYVVVPAHSNSRFRIRCPGAVSKSIPVE